MRISRYRAELTDMPVDLLADPDGFWDYDSLVEAAGFDPSDEGVSIGALSQPYGGHPDGSAVVSRSGSEYLAIVECVPEPIRLPLPQRQPAFVERAA